MRQLSLQRGVGLVEVLVAVLLLSVAVLGFSALQLRAISATDESLVRTQAMSIVRGLAENMRANPLQLEAYKTTINDPTKTPDITSASCKALNDNCSSKQVAVKEAKSAVKQLQQHGIEIKMIACPGTSGFSETKCVIAAWGDTTASLDDANPVEPDPDDTDPVQPDAKACANESGIYKSGSTCVIVEAY